MKMIKPPYFAVIFSSSLPEIPVDYRAAADRMVALAHEQKGFLGIESVRNTAGDGITISYWTDEAAMKNWRDNAEHTLVRERGRADWYTHFEVKIGKVERAYGME